MRYDLHRKLCCYRGGNVICLGTCTEHHQASADTTESSRDSRSGSLLLTVDNNIFSSQHIIIITYCTRGAINNQYTENEKKTVTTSS